MKKFSIWGCALLIAAWGGAADGYELEPGVNNAAVIEYPTALDQFLESMVHSTIEVFDAAEPDLALTNVRYGHQIGAFQLLGDIYLLSDPKWELDHAVLRAKLRILQFDEEHTAVAFGALARLTADDEAADRVDNRPYSFLGVITTELFPFRDWGGFLVNFYLDNRVGVLGLKGQVFPLIQGVRAATGPPDAGFFQT